MSNESNNSGDIRNQSQGKGKNQPMGYDVETWDTNLAECTGEKITILSFIIDNEGSFPIAYMKAMISNSFKPYFFESASPVVIQQLMFNEKVTTFPYFVKVVEYGNTVKFEHCL